MARRKCGCGQRTIAPPRKYKVRSLACLSDRPASFWLLDRVLFVEDLEACARPFACVEGARPVRGFEPPVQAFWVGVRLEEISVSTELDYLADSRHVMTDIKAGGRAWEAYIPVWLIGTLSFSGIAILDCAIRPCA